MARYSSDSDSDHSSRYRRRRNRRSRSSSSDSSDSSPHRKRSSKHSKTKRRHRSHSRSRDRDRDRSQKSYKSSRSSHSKDREKRRYHSTAARSRSSDRFKRKLRSVSREKSGSRSSSSQSNIKTIVPEKTQNIVPKGIINLIKYFSDDFSIEPCYKEGVIDEINAEGFVPKQFSSSNTKEKKFKNIVIDISADTIQIPAVTDVPSGPESIFHSSIMLDQEPRFDKWVKKLYTIRQKAIADIHSTIT